MFHCVRSEKETCYTNLNSQNNNGNPNTSKGACKNLLYLNYMGYTTWPANIEFVNCIAYLEKEKECKNKSAIIPNTKR